MGRGLLRAVAAGLGGYAQSRADSEGKNEDMLHLSIRDNALSLKQENLARFNHDLDMQAENARQDRQDTRQTAADERADKRNPIGFSKDNRPIYKGDPIPEGGLYKDSQDRDRKPVGYSKDGRAVYEGDKVPEGGIFAAAQSRREPGAVGLSSDAKKVNELVAAGYDETDAIERVYGIGAEVDDYGEVIKPGLSRAGSGGKEPKTIMSYEEAEKRATKMANQKAGWLSTDKTDFGEEGKDQWIHNKALELMGSQPAAGSAPKGEPEAGPQGKATAKPSLESLMTGVNKPGVAQAATVPGGQETVAPPQPAQVAEETQEEPQPAPQKKGLLSPSPGNETHTNNNPGMFDSTGFREVADGMATAGRAVVDGTSAVGRGLLGAEKRVGDIALAPTKAVGRAAGPMVDKTREVAGEVGQGLKKAGTEITGIGKEQPMEKKIAEVQDVVREWKTMSPGQLKSDAFYKAVMNEAAELGVPAQAVVKMIAEANGENIGRVTVILGRLSKTGPR